MCWKLAAHHLQEFFICVMPMSAAVGFEAENPICSLAHVSSLSLMTSTTAFDFSLNYLQTSTGIQKQYEVLWSEALLSEFKNIEEVRHGLRDKVFGVSLWGGFIFDRYTARFVG